MLGLNPLSCCSSFYSRWWLNFHLVRSNPPSSSKVCIELLSGVTTRVFCTPQFSCSYAAAPILRLLHSLFPSICNTQVPTLKLLYSCFCAQAATATSTFNNSRFLLAFILASSLSVVLAAINHLLSSCNTLISALKLLQQLPLTRIVDFYLLLFWRFHFRCSSQLLTTCILDLIWLDI